MTCGVESRFLEEIVRRYRSRMFAIAYGIIGNKEDAEEITQDSLFKIYRNEDRFDVSRSVWPWVKTITRNEALRRYGKGSAKRRIQSLHLSPEPHDTRPGPDLVCERREAIRLSLRAMHSLPELQRQALLLCGIEGIDLESAGARCRSTRRSMASHLSRARRQLRSTIDR